MADAATRKSAHETKTRTPEPVHPAFVEKALRWLVDAQHSAGGWGAGSHARQNVRNPHEVQTDPATTAFTTMALLRAGYLQVHDDAIRRAAHHLVNVVKESPADARITTLAGTQPQAKLGDLIDTSMTAQLLARILPTLGDDDPLRPDVDAALDRCITKLSSSQQSDGSWGKGG